MSQPAITTLPERAVLRLDGPDARGFLQGLISNDVERLTAENAVYAALLTPQGKYLFDFILVADGDAILVDAEAARLPALLQRLTMYRLRSKVTLSAAADLAVCAAFGPGLDADLPQRGRVGDALIVADPRLPALGLRILLPRQNVEEFIAAHPLMQAQPEAYDRYRLDLGVPDGSRDLVIDKSILLESGFEELHGVAFDKGCFVGQELTARTKYRGLVKKRLVPVEIDGPAPESGTQVLADGRDAGEMRSSRDGRGLALLRLEFLETAVPLVAGESRLRPVRPDWIVLPKAAG
ncbi:MAG: folate-binding protein [Geminicoccaceae bacterium]